MPPWHWPCSGRRLPGRRTIRTSRCALSSDLQLVRHPTWWRAPSRKSSAGRSASHSSSKCALGPGAKLPRSTWCARRRMVTPYNRHAGTNLAIALYPSTAQATTDLMTGRISIAFSSAANVLQLVEEGKLTALAVAQPRRAAMIPQVPSIDEIARCVCEHLDWDARARRHTAADRRHAVEDDQRGAQGRGRCEPTETARDGADGGGPEDFALRIKSDTARWDAVLQAAGLGN